MASAFKTADGPRGEKMLPHNWSMMAQRLTKICWARPAEVQAGGYKIDIQNPASVSLSSTDYVYSTPT